MTTPSDQIVVAAAGRSDIRSRDRLPSLTGLRFYAALLVVAYHLSAGVGHIRYLDWLVAYGRTGVTFFFVLSGFVLAWTYLDVPTRFTVFIWRRFARLWPLVAVTGVLSLLAFRFVDVAIPRWQGATTFLFLQAWDPGWAVGANGSAWSLSDEAFFYLLFPLLLALFARARLRVGLVVILILSYVVVWYLFVSQGWIPWRLDYWPVTRTLQFSAGVACAVAMQRGMRAPVNYWIAIAAVIGFHLGLHGWERANGGELFGGGLYSAAQWWSMPVFSLLIMAAAQRDLDGRATLVRGPISLRLGHWSYAWYLIHGMSIRVWVHQYGASSGGLATVATWIALLALTIAAAGMLYTVVEHPAERILRRLGPQPDRSAGSDDWSRPPEVVGVIRDAGSRRADGSTPGRRGAASRTRGTPPPT